MNDRQKIMVDDFKREVLEKFPDLERSIYLEEYEKGAYCISVSKPDMAYGKSLFLDCDFSDRSITVGHDIYDEVYLSYNKNTWIRRLREAISMMDEMYSDVDDSGDDKWSVIEIESFWNTRYNKELSILEIKFPGGQYYHYYDFDNIALDNLIKSDNPLVYFNKEIRNKYKYDRVIGGYSDAANKKKISIFS